MIPGLFLGNYRRSGRHTVQMFDDRLRGLRRRTLRRDIR
jgi:hypothetical protein